MKPEKPKDHVKLVNIQGRVPETYFLQVRGMMDEHQLNWNQVMTKCLKHILDGKLELKASLDA
jgi:hypothetical protein